MSGIGRDGMGSTWTKFIDWLFPWCPSGMPHRVKHGVVKNVLGHEFCWHEDCVRANFKECRDKDNADKKRLNWILESAYESDGAWLLTMCLDVHKGGIRAAIDERLNHAAQSEMTGAHS